MGEKQILIQDTVIESLINEGCKLDKQAKIIEEKLKGIKTELQVLEIGRYRTTAGKTVNISQLPIYSEISPESVKTALRDKRLGKNYSKCVKVNITNLKRFLSDQEIGNLRDVVEYSRRHSFK